jgi:putative PEP-CTERM system histidine kinase
MKTFGSISYVIASLSFLALTALLATSWRGRRQGAYLIAASAITVAWGLALALQVDQSSLSLSVVYLAEVMRGAAWLLALAAIAGVAAPPGLILAARALCGVLLTGALLLPLAGRFGISFEEPTLLLSRTGLVLALFGLVLIEQIYRNSSLATRKSLRYFAIGVGGLFAYDLFLYSQAELLRGITPDAWSVRGFLNAFAVPLIAISARRNPSWSLDVFVSRQVVFYTTTFIAVGAYLLIMAVGGYYVREIGGEWGRVGQIMFMAGAAVVLSTLVASSSLRRHARVFISKHFYRNKYDYRIEWLRFINTLSAVGEDVKGTSIRAVAEIFSSPGGILFVADESQRRLVPSAAWPIALDAVLGIEELRTESDVVDFLSRTQWVIDLHEYRRVPDLYQNIVLPEWLRAHPSIRIIAPLWQQARLVGLMLLFDPPPPFDLTYEDRDLLKTVGRHVATHIAQHDADRRLAESRQFEAFNRLTAFMMHDLKNSVAQLKLIVANATRHRHNPEFFEDTIGTIANAAERMTRLIEQLKGSPERVRSARVDFVELVRQTVARTSDRDPAPTIDGNTEAIFVLADQDRLASVLEHVIRNAQDAVSGKGTVVISLARRGTEAELVVVDTGAGMDARFVRERLFRPFDSTKGSKGMGIGAYQAREYVRALGGDVEVQSSPGQGTRFSISLPVAEIEPHEPIKQPDAHV